MSLEKLYLEVEELRKKLAEKEEELELEKNAAGRWLSCEQNPEDKLKLELLAGYAHILSSHGSEVDIEVVLNRRKAGALGRALVKFSEQAK